MDESKEAAAEGKATGLLTLAEVPSWVTHDAANDRHQVMCCLGLGSQYDRIYCIRSQYDRIYCIGSQYDRIYCIDCVRHEFPAAAQPQ